VTSGGVAGLRRERVVETQQLPQGEREAFEHYVEAAAFFELPERRVSGHPDVIQYRIRIERSGHVHEITVDDETADEPLRSLVSRALEEGDAS